MYGGAEFAIGVFGGEYLPSFEREPYRARRHGSEDSRRAHAALSGGGQESFEPVNTGAGVRDGGCLPEVGDRCVSFKPVYTGAESAKCRLAASEAREATLREVSSPFTRGSFATAGTHEERLHGY